MICPLAITAGTAIGIGPEPDTIFKMVVIPSTSDAPSSSFGPLSAPTACVTKILYNVKQVDMLHDDSYITRIVVDVKNALVTAHGRKQTQHSILSNWVRGSYFIDNHRLQFSLLFCIGNLNRQIFEERMNL